MHLERVRKLADDRSVLLILQTLAGNASSKESVLGILQLVSTYPNVVVQLEAISALCSIFYRHTELCTSRIRIDLYRLIYNNPSLPISYSKVLAIVDPVFSQRSVWHIFCSTRMKERSPKNQLMKVLKSMQTSQDETSLRHAAMKLNKLIRYFPAVVSLGEATETSLDLEGLYQLLTRSLYRKQQYRSVYLELARLSAYLDSLLPALPYSRDKMSFIGLHPLLKECPSQSQETLENVVNNCIAGLQREVWSFRLSWLLRDDRDVLFDSLLRLLSEFPRNSELPNQQYLLCKCCVDILESREGKQFFPQNLDEQQDILVRQFFSSAMQSIAKVLESSVIERNTIQKYLAIAPVITVLSHFARKYPQRGPFPISEQQAKFFYSRIITTNDPILANIDIPFDGQCSLFGAIAALLFHYPQLATYQLYGMVYYGLTIEEMKTSCYSVLLTLLRHHFYFLCESLIRMMLSQREADRENLKYREIWTQIDDLLPQYDQEPVSPALTPFDRTPIEQIEQLLQTPLTGTEPEPALTDVLEKLKYHPKWRIWIYRTWLRYIPPSSADRHTAVHQLFQILRGGLATGLVQRLGKDCLDSLLLWSNKDYECDIAVRRSCLVCYQLLLSNHLEQIRPLLQCRVGVDPEISEFNVLTKIISLGEREDLTIRWTAINLFISLDRQGLIYPNRTGNDLQRIEYARKKDVQSFLLHKGLSDPNRNIQHLCLDYFQELLNNSLLVLPLPSLISSCCSLLYHSDSTFVELVAAIMRRILSSESDSSFPCLEVMFDWLLLQPEKLQRVTLERLSPSLCSEFWTRYLLQIRNAPLPQQRRSLAVVSMLRHCPNLIRDVLSEILNQQFPFLEIVQLYYFVVSQCQAQTTIVESLKFGLESISHSDLQTGATDSFLSQFYQKADDFSRHYLLFRKFAIQETKAFTIEKRKELQNLYFTSQLGKSQLDSFRETLQTELEDLYGCAGSSLFSANGNEGVFSSHLLLEQCWETITALIDSSVRPLLTIAQNLHQQSNSLHAIANPKVKFLSKLLIPMAWNLFSVSVCFSEKARVLKVFLDANKTDCQKLLTFIFKKFLETPKNPFDIEGLIPTSLCLDQLGVEAISLHCDYFLCSTPTTTVGIDTNEMLDLLREITERLARIDLVFIEEIVTEPPILVQEICQMIWRGIVESFDGSCHTLPRAVQFGLVTANCLKNIVRTFHPNCEHLMSAKKEEFIQNHLPADFTPSEFFLSYSRNILDTSHHWLVSELLYLHQKDSLFPHLFKDYSGALAAAAPRLLQYEDFDKVIRGLESLAEELLITKVHTIEHDSQHHHVFFSHDWGLNDQNHKRVKLIYDSIQRMCPTIPLWLDQTHLYANMRDRICAALTKSSCLLVFLTKNYSNKIDSKNPSDYCYLEYNGAPNTIPKIIVILDDEMRNRINWSDRIRSEHQNDKFYVVNPNDPSSLSDLITRICGIYGK